jgi:hypothetical protein
MVIRVSSRQLSSQVLKLITHLHLVPGLRMGGFIPLLLPPAFMATLQFCKFPNRSFYVHALVHLYISTYALIIIIIIIIIIRTAAVGTAWHVNLNILGTQASTSEINNSYEHTANLSQQRTMYRQPARVALHKTELVD